MSAKRQVELSKHEVDVLLGLYSGCECLWNSQASDYKEKQARTAAFRTIANGLRLETGKEMSIDQVASKIRSVMSIYEQELQKVLQSQKESNGREAYHSQWRWFSFLDSFLHIHVSGKLGNPEMASNDDPDKFLFDNQTSADVHSDSIKNESDHDAGCHSDGTSGVIEVDSKGTLSPSDKIKRQLASAVRSHEKRTSPRAASASNVREDVTAEGALAARRSSRKRQHTNRYTPPTDLLPHTTPITILPRPPPPIHAALLAPTSVPVSGPIPTVHTPTSTPISDSVSASIANTLFTLQTLMAKSLSAQDHPSFVFAKHISNELDSITDYKKRKQCMLEIQQVILRYQTSDHRSVKRESVDGIGNDNDIEDIEEHVGAKVLVTTGDGVAQQHHMYVDSFAVQDDHPPVYFGIPGTRQGNGGVV